MHRRKFLRHSAAAASLGVIGLAGCAGNGGTATETPGSKRPPNTVLMVTEGNKYYFDPIGLFIEPGETVTWEIKNGTHSSTAYEKGNGYSSVTRIPDGADGWNSEILGEPGATYQHTFETKGTYDYFCIPHKSLGMVARIVVGEPGGPAEGSMPPDGKVPKSQRIVDEGSISYDEFSG